MQREQSFIGPASIEARMTFELLDETAARPKRRLLHWKLTTGRFRLVALDR
jgi:hypothetical protein